jgi:hypothetical protein
MTDTKQPKAKPSLFRDLPAYPWLDPCPRCGYRGSCDCTVKERAQAAYPNLLIHEGWQ